MKHFILIFCFALTFISAMARDVKDFFTDEVAVMSMIEPVSRMDMVDYYQNGINKEMDNFVGEKARIDTITSNTIRFDFAPNVRGELAVLTSGSSDTIITLVTTVATPAPDSEIKFYDKSWKEISSRFPRLKLQDFVTLEGKKHFKEIQKEIPFLISSLEFAKDGNEIIVTPGFSSILPSETYKRLQPWLKDRLSFKWSGKKFILSL